MAPPPLHSSVCLRELPAGDGNFEVGGSASGGPSPEGGEQDECGLLSAFETLRQGAFPWLLDSALPGSRLGRFSFAGSDPYLVLRAFGERLELDGRRPVRPDIQLGPNALEHDPFEAVRALLPPVPTETFSHRHSALEPAELVGLELPFLGGAVGYWGYELAQQIEAVELHARDDLGLPDLVLLFVDRLLAFDHRSSRGYAIGTGFGASPAQARARAEKAVDELWTLLGVAIPDGSRKRAAQETQVGAELRRSVLRTRVPERLRCDLDEDRHAKAVTEILDNIVAGQVYQVNLTQRMELPIDARLGADPWSLYRELRRLSPAPFASYLELPELCIASSSPERFLRVDEEGRVESRPIKGTRPRGVDEAEDRALRAELAASEKDRAENLMIVDLVRNDLGRVCEIGSVEVPELHEIEEYATVFQMVSSVCGKLREDRDVLDLLCAAFPPGSMTGAPKIAAMQLIDRLESRRRTVYSGAIGYLDCRGGADLSVVIRTLLLKDGRAFLHVGGGVVADSTPASEYGESLDKARALLAALERAAGVMQ